MSDLVQDSDIGRRRRERAVGAIERIEGIVAATVQLGAGTRIESVRAATTTEVASPAMRDMVIASLRELGYEIDHDAVHVSPIGGSVPAPSVGSAPPPVHDGSAPANPSSDRSAAHEPAANEAPAAASIPEPPTPPSIEANGPQIEDQGPPPAWHGRFLVLDSVEVRRNDARVVCTVRLKRLGESFSAEVQELDTAQGRARAAARAALLAAEKAGEGVGLSLEGVVIQEFFGRQYVLAFVDGVAHRRFASLSGILAVENSVETTAALSILRAVERWVAW